MSRVQLAPTVPTVVSDDVKLTLPDGIFEAVVVSVTATEQDEVPVGTMEAGVQLTLVEVLSCEETVTAMAAAVLVLVL